MAASHFLPEAGIGILRHDCGKILAVRRDQVVPPDGWRAHCAWTRCGAVAGQQSSKDEPGTGSTPQRSSIYLPEARSFRCHRGCLCCAFASVLRTRHKNSRTAVVIAALLYFLTSLCEFAARNGSIKSGHVATRSALELVPGLGPRIRETKTRFGLKPRVCQHPCFCALALVSQLWPP